MGRLESAVGMLSLKAYILLYSNYILFSFHVPMTSNPPVTALNKGLM